MVIDIAFGCLTISILLTTYRMLRGPTWGDRLVALDFLAVNLAVTVVVLALTTGYSAFLDAALIISILGFVSTAAFAHYLLRGRVME